jgi:hypothetical protein
VPTNRFYQTAAYAIALTAAAPAAHGVVFHSTGDPTFHTAPPTTGTFANSGWQYQLDIGEVSGTAVGPHHYLAAAHTGAGTNNAFVYNGVAYQTTAVVADFGDLRLLRVDKPFHSYAPLYSGAPESEQDAQVVLIGRGTQRGAEVRVNGVLKGWRWGALDGVRRWGTNNVSSFANNSTLMRFNFDNNGDPNEAILSDKDSGGGAFIKVAQQWTLAGVNFAVTGPYSIPPDPTTFLAALYDTTGMLNHQTVAAGAPSTGPSGAYASMVSPYTSDLKTLMDLPPTWNSQTGGNWLTASNWDLPAGKTVPNAVGAIADFRTAIGAPATITFSGIVTVGQIDFDNTNSYTIVGGLSASQVHLNVASGNATVNVASGNHSISALHLDDPTTLHVIQPASTLTANISSAAGQPITKTGAGTLAVNRLVSGAINVSQGTVRVNSNGTSGATSKVPGVSVNTAGGAKLDLANNDMVVTNTPPGQRVGGSYTGLTGLIAQAYASSAWTGLGMTSSAAAASGGVTSLGIAQARDALGITGTQTTLWSGQTVSPGDTLIAYTYGGDANLDGLIDAQDYGIIDNFVQFPGASGYSNGDFNYDGVIDAVDYGIIDNNIQVQGPPLISSAAGAADVSGAGALQGISAVPEPAATSLVAFASVALLSRRRQRHHRAT